MAMLGSDRESPPGSSLSGFRDLYILEAWIGALVPLGGEETEFMGP